ncbi:protein-L-isoaspartate carboxylmethyltransferase [Naumannella sp. ID2617S]|nr:protein-L-isoaspartate carboxylmethyltransferase [Naumannella sp. ID2617S]
MSEQRVSEAMRATPRAGFLPAAQRAYADRDVPLRLSAGQTNSQPSTVATMLELLDVPVGARVLDVGAGSGWTTAILAELVGPQGWVLGLELLPELAQWGAANLAAVARPWARIETAEPGRLGRAVECPYDRILVSAMADTLPDELVEQLTDEGMLVVPVAGAMARVTRRPSADPLIERSGAYRFVPLR